ncbi:unnamed protein product [Effrenium voratum]|uniref:Pentatricopeptide repeat-containing protein, chloroplastic n=1 Tax=Effrenium voratum TaxID=2562239 RepID=A0AA36JE34_9DINO|nr:unnamed protein product [Effrenium voratum]
MESSIRRQIMVEMEEHVQQQKAKDAEAQQEIARESRAKERQACFKCELAMCLSGMAAKSTQDGNVIKTATKMMRGWHQSLRLLEELHARQVTPDTICYSAAVAACSGDGRWLEAVALLQRMQEEMVEPNERTFSAAISGCEKARQWPAALVLLVEAQRRRSCNSYCINAAISACEKGGQWITALHLLSQMRPQSLQPDVFSYSGAASACEKGRAWTAALEVQCQLESNRVEPNVVSYGAVLAACTSHWKGALEVLSRMRCFRMTPNLISYNAAVNACDQGARGDLALSLLHEAQCSALIPDATFYSVALSACRRGRFWQTALQLNDLCGEMVGGIFALQACDVAPTFAARLGAELRQRVARAEAYQVFSGVDELHERDLLDHGTAATVTRRCFRAALGRLCALGNRRQQGAWRLQEPLLERQPSLG